jgi:hypothetical protein
MPMIYILYFVVIHLIGSTVGVKPGSQTSENKALNRLAVVGNLLGKAGIFGLSALATFSAVNAAGNKISQKLKSDNGDGTQYDDDSRISLFSAVDRRTGNHLLLTSFQYRMDNRC